MEKKISGFNVEPQGVTLPKGIKYVTMPNGTIAFVVPENTKNKSKKDK